MALQDLGYFTGSEQWHRHPLFRKFTYTDGVQYVAEEGGAYWLIDKIMAVQTLPKLRNQAFQAWTFKVQDEKGELIATDGNSNVLYREYITYTDFPLQEIKFYFTDNVLLLTSEY